MRKIFAVLMITVLTLSGCTPGTQEPADPLAGWLASANLEAEETPEELYAAALEENMLVVYSTSTRMMDVAAAFEKHYPGLLVKVEHIREEELYNKLLENYESGDFTCDLIISADGRGIMTNEFLLNNIAVKYVPYDIKDKILPGNNGDFLMLAGEASVLSYNGEYYSEPPVNNWWELTEETWRGMVYLPSPTRSMTTLAFFCTVIQHSDEMAKAYEGLYGKPLELTEGENAGREFIRRFMMNSANIVNSSDETAEEIGMPGSLSPSVGIIVSSKTRLRDIGYEMVNHYEMEPFCGVYTPINVMMAGGAKNVNAAKLFVRWLLGETDGQGEGYKPYLQSGAWTVRNDVRDDTGVRIEDLNLWRLDRDYLYENQKNFLEFWEELIISREEQP
jgi:iron(III) transport system substrate-binding protein